MVCPNFLHHSSLFFCLFYSIDCSNVLRFFRTTIFVHVSPSFNLFFLAGRFWFVYIMYLRHSLACMPFDTFKQSDSSACLLPQPKSVRPRSALLRETLLRAHSPVRVCPSSLKSELWLTVCAAASVLHSRIRSMIVRRSSEFFDLNQTRVWPSVYSTIVSLFLYRRGGIFKSN